MANVSSTVRGVSLSKAEGGVTAAQGFRSSALHCGIKAKAGALDLLVLASDARAAVAGIFTTNLVQAAPVTVSKRHLTENGGYARAIVVNSGCANACTGPQGLADADRSIVQTAMAKRSSPRMRRFSSRKAILSARSPRRA